MNGDFQEGQSKGVRLVSWGRQFSPGTVVGCSPEQATAIPRVVTSSRASKCPMSSKAEAHAYMPVCALYHFEAIVF